MDADSQKFAEERNLSLERHHQRMDTLKNNFDAEFSKEAIGLEQKLETVRAVNDQKLNQVEKETERDLEKLKQKNRIRIARYIENADQQYNRLKEQYENSAKALHDRALKQHRQAGVEFEPGEFKTETIALNDVELED